MTNKELAKIIYPNVTKTIEDYENMFPKRNISENAIVTRFAPSPTGFVHMGSLLTAFIARKVADDTNGIFILRIEDTDEKRTVENGIQGIIDDLNSFNINIDEGVISENEEIGLYGPYIQTQRKEIYDTFASYLIENDYAYPCFCTEEELNTIRQKQEGRKDRIGYYGEYAKYRDVSNDEKAKLIKEGKPFVIRLKSHGDYEKKITFNDAVRGKITFPENDMDTVLIKSNGIPVYHFAVVVDDHLMKVTHILRAEEWISSTPIHLELYKDFGFDVPTICHLGVVMKIDENNCRRKLSKRKDPEAAVSFYKSLGYNIDAVKLYLLTIANSNFEIWYDQNKDKNVSEFKLNFKKISESGTLFDIEKLNNISKTYISKMKAETLYEEVLKYSKEYDIDFYNIINLNKEYTISLLNIERQVDRPRKDISCYSDVRKEFSYMFDELFNSYNCEIKDFYKIETLKDYFNNIYNENDDKQTWFDKIKDFAPKYNFATDNKLYKENTDKYAGNVSSLCELIRVAVTDRTNTPDLYEILKLLGTKKIEKRIEMFEKYLKQE